MQRGDSGQGPARFSCREGGRCVQGWALRSTPPIPSHLPPALGTICGGHLLGSRKCCSHPIRHFGCTAVALETHLGGVLGFRGGLQPDEGAPFIKSLPTKSGRQGARWTLCTPCHLSVGTWSPSARESLLTGPASLSASWSTHPCRAVWSLHAPVPRKVTSRGHLDRSSKRVSRTYFKLWG